jgi:hypothetical protein
LFGSEREVNFLVWLCLPGLQMAAGPVHHFTPERYADAGVIRFANGTSIDTRPSPSAGSPEPEIRGPESGSYWLMHCSGPVRQDWLRELRLAGADPVCYLAWQTVVCHFARAVPAGQLTSLPFVDWLGPFPASAKLAPQLANGGHGDFVLSVWPGEDPEPVARTLAEMGASVSEVGRRTVYFSLSPASLGRVATLDAVAWLQEKGRCEPFNHEMQWVMQVGWRPEPPDELAGRRVWQHGVRGRNTLVGLVDSGIYTDHDMFVDPNQPITGPGVFPLHRKIAAYKLYRTATFGDVGAADYHGSAVAGTLAGDDSIAGNAAKMDGLAPDSRIYFVDNANGFGVYVFDDDLTELLDSVRLGLGMPEPVRQVSGSFGNGTELGYYRLEEASLDAVCWEDKQFLVVWAAGNYGLGQYRLGHPSGAKNALTLGACGNSTQSNLVSGFSSRGPCRDGRIKPTLVAPGENIATVDGHGPHMYWRRDGTSFAAPAASAALTLVRQYLREGRLPTGEPDSLRSLPAPSSCLMRALAVASADFEVGEEYMPNDDAGWGRLDLANILHFSGDSVAVALNDDPVGLGTGEYRDFAFELDTRAPLRVVLAWTDTAAAPLAQIALVNDLNLLLTSPDGNHYRGNQFYQNQSATNPPGWDERNVEEVCQVGHPLTGRWTARVLGRNVYSPRQDYSLVVRTGAAGHVPSISETRVLPARTRPAFGSLPGLPLGAGLTLFGADGRIVLGENQRGRPDRPLSPGVYFYRITASGASPQSGKLVICR